MGAVKRLVIGVLVMLIVSSSVVFAAGSDPWPTKPIELYIGWPPGGNVDLVVRSYLSTFSKELGVPVVVNYKPGAGGVVCAEYIARAKPDGYTIQEVSYSIISMQLLTVNTPITYNDFTFIMGHTGQNFAVVVRQDAPWKTFKEWVEYARKKPATYGVPGVYTSQSVVMDWIIKREGLKEVSVVPYQGGNELIAPVMGGHIDLALVAGNHVPLCEGGKLRTLLQFSGEVPDPDPAKVPFLTQAYPDCPDSLRAMVEIPVGLTGPKGMPAPIVQKLAQSLRKAVNEEGYKNFLKQSKRPLVTNWEGADAMKRAKMATDAYAAYLKQVGFVKK